jgi:hypothetical protein
MTTLADGIKLAIPGTDIATPAHGPSAGPGRALLQATVASARPAGEGHGPARVPAASGRRALPL